MLTALVLQLIQCVVVLPDWLVPKGDSEKKKDEDSESREKSKVKFLGFFYKHLPCK
jgi:hypothetical protein